MLKKRMIFIGILSLIITLMSPYIFFSYFEEKPEILKQNISFGGPFPYAMQMISLPDDDDLYPMEVKFESPFDKETTFKILPFFFSFSFFFLFLFAFYSIVSRFIRKPLKEPK